MAAPKAEPMAVERLADFWKRVRAARHRFLALDYDGTLAPFQVDPMRARPLAGIPALLQALNQMPGMSVAILSGRPVRELALLLGDLGVALVGCHGREGRDRKGRGWQRAPQPRQQQGLDQAAAVVRRLGWEDRLEIKIGSVAFHTRGVSAAQASFQEQRVWAEWCRIGSSGLGCRRFQGGVEIHCTDWNKGDALAELLRGAPPETLPVYIGDDATDEDVFRLLATRGIGIKVGGPQQATAAVGFLRDTDAVRAFLTTWLAVLAEDSERGFKSDGSA